MTNPQAGLLARSYNALRTKLTGIAAGIKELAGPMGGQSPVRSALDEPAYAGMTFEQLATILRDAAQLDNLAAYYRAADRLEELDPQWRSLIGTRKLAVLGCEWRISAKDQSAPQKAKAEMLNALVARDDFPDLMMHLLDAVSKGVAVAEIMWEVDAQGFAMPAKLLPRPQRWFEFDKLDGQTLLLKTGPQQVAALEPDRFIVHTPMTKSGLPIKRGLAIPGLACTLTKMFLKKFQASYLERAGHPARFARYAEGTPKEQVSRMRAMLAEMGPQGFGVFPKNFDIEVSNALNTGNITAYDSAIRYADEQNAKLVLGQTQTSESTGAAYASAKVGQEVKVELTKSDARQLCATLKRDLFRAVVRFNFGDEDLPTILLAVDEPEDLKAEAEILKEITQAGVKVSAAEVRAKFGYREPEAGEETTIVGQQAAPLPAAQSRRARCPVHDTHAQDTPPRDSLDDLADGMAAEWEQVSQQMLADFLKAAAKNPDPDAFARAIEEVAKTATPRELVALLKQGRVVAGLVGAAGGDIGDGEA